MEKNIFYKLKKLIISNDLDQSQIKSIIENYQILNLTKAKARQLISIYEKVLMRNVGILDRDVSFEIKENIKRQFEIKDIIIKDKQCQNINQRLQIGDTVFSFDIKRKISRLSK